MSHTARHEYLLGSHVAQPKSPIELLDLIVEGFPVLALERVSRMIAPADANFKYRVVSKTTLSRRRDRLSSHESERLVRLTDIWAEAVDVWKSEEAARAFLFRPHALLQGRLPIDVVLMAEGGGQIVKDILGRLKYGTAA